MHGVRKVALAAGVVACLVFVSTSAWGTAYTIYDRNSTATFEVGAGTPGAKGGGYDLPGMLNWTVEGERFTYNHMYQQWFWYRVGTTGPEQSIDHLALTAAVLSDTNGGPPPFPGLPGGDDRPDALTLRYADDLTAPTFGIELKYGLSGGMVGEDGVSDIMEQITIFNLGGSTLDFHFFQYTDFDLSESPDDDSAWIVNDNAVKQVESGENHLTASETVILPKPSHYEVAPWDTTLAKLEDSLPTTLADVGGPIFYQDVTWAFQWDFSIPVGGSAQISKDKQLTFAPEPVTAAGLLLSVGCLARYVRRRRHLHG
ncbi:MAG TPA: hypothetical protein VM238_17205 [Phycisphaerae bacterium]|nr:hypothetical protein [Phycisphaerae bacterium]